MCVCEVIGMSSMLRLIHRDVSLTSIYWNFNLEGELCSCLLQINLFKYNEENESYGEYIKSGVGVVRDRV